VAAHSLRHHDPGHPVLLDWLLILVGALFAWLVWPATYVHP